MGYGRQTEAIVSPDCERHCGNRACGLGQVDLKRLLLWYTMLDATDIAHDAAMHALDRFAESGTVGSVSGFLWLPEMKPLRSHPRFQELVQRLGDALRCREIILA